MCWCAGVPSCLRISTLGLAMQQVMYVARAILLVGRGNILHFLSNKLSQHNTACKTIALFVSPALIQHVLRLFIKLGIF